MTISIRESIKKNDALGLVFYAAASLYLELALIRFTAAEVLYLGYFSNFILISAFIGLGLGFLSYKRGIKTDQYLPFLMLFIFSLVLVSEFDVTILRDNFGEFFFGNISGRSGLPGSFLLATLLISTVILFTGLGCRIAESFSKFRPLTAYTLDISGSILGIVLFSLHSLVSSSPVTWIITTGLLLVAGYLISGSKSAMVYSARVLLACICIVIILFSARENTHTVWSSYQKLEYIAEDNSGPGALYANGILHQYLNYAESQNNEYYGVPYFVRGGKPLDNVLIIGAGTGTDVAVSLGAGAKQIDAVDIDGDIINIGRQFHPDAPYQDPRVTTYITDGRQFLRNSEKKYDLIIFALPDSLVRMSAMSSVRLESYLFTLEAFNDAKHRLKEDGMFAMYNQYRWEWLVNKLATSVQSTFNLTPLIVHDGITTVILAGKDIDGNFLGVTYPARMATDDWPFVYVEKPGIHWAYILMIMSFIIVTIIGILLVAPKGTLRNPDGQFFFMGMAFLLLETKSLAFFSLLFGTTWFVNSMAFLGILVSVLIANLCVQYFQISNRKILYSGLFIALLVAYLLPASTFLNIEMPVLRYVMAIILVFSPVFFANLIFSREFRDTDESTQAFGWNLLGAVIGGGMEYFSLITGFNNLLFIVAICYAIAGIIQMRQPAVSVNPGQRFSS